MAQDDPNLSPDAEEASEGPSIEGGNYELIRARLTDLSQELGEKARALDTKRTELFGDTQFEIIANERVRTETKCIPRDLLPVADRLLLGFKVNLGLRTEMRVEDVFSLHRFDDTPEGYDFSQTEMDDAGGFLVDPGFDNDFKELFRYYKDTKLLQLRRIENKILAVFQIGASVDDVKVFRWRVRADDTPVYMDINGESDHVFPSSHDFSWKGLTRDDYVTGQHPHASIENEVFVETVGGDLTIKIEDNTEDGEGIYSEPVEDSYQSLDDGTIEYARVGALILLRILPFREETWRHFIFNTRTKSVHRIDAIGQACIRLPAEHGVIFPGGYYLQNGEHKVFDADTAGLEFKSMMRSPNNEDVLYVFQRRVEGLYILYPYNLIRQELQNPIACHGYSIFDDGRMAIFRADNDEEARVHKIQVWQTPFMSQEYADAAPTDGSFLSKIGNADLVRGISDAYAIRRMILNQEPTRKIYEDLIAATTRVMDQHYWLEHEDVGDMLSTLRGVRRNGELIIDEFEKVLALQSRAEETMRTVEARQEEIIRSLRPGSWRSVDQYIAALTDLRNQLGELIQAEENTRYIDTARIKELKTEIEEQQERISKACIEFLLRDDALKPLIDQLEELLARIEEAPKTNVLEPLITKLDELNAGLNLLNEVVNNLQVDDPTKRVEILNGISEVFGQLNRVRATAQSRRKELLGAEGRAEFAAQFKLLSQSISNGLTLADTPEACDEQLSRLLLQLQDLESRFSEFDEFLLDLTDKRQEMVEAFEARKQTLLEARQRRIENLGQAAERILEGVTRRVKSLKTEKDLNAYFASDAMILKLRKVSEDIRELGDTVRADELDARLKAAQQDALRGLRDRLDLFDEGEDLIKFGRHRFSVNTQPLELTMVPRGGGMVLHLTGTDYYETITREDFLATREFWSQSVVSEDPSVYRGEFLAARVLFAAERGEDGLSVAHLTEASVDHEAGLLEIVRAYAAERYDEGYERGLHDADAAAILEQLLALRTTSGLLRFSAPPRAMACLFWAFFEDTDQRALWHRRAMSLGRLRSVFAHSPALAALCSELSGACRDFLEAHDIPFDSTEVPIMGRYLAEELMVERPRFTTSGEAQKLREDLLFRLQRAEQQRAFLDDLRSLERNLRERYDIAHAWVEAFVASQALDRQQEAEEGSGAALSEEVEAQRALIAEVAVLLLTERQLERAEGSGVSAVEVTGLLGQHPRVQNRSMTLRLDAFLTRLGHFIEERVPGYREYRKIRSAILEEERDRLRLEEFKPRVLSAFVRNRLINEVYLPMVGDNLAKQMGAAGDKKRTDLMGLLLLISPPGYGKTTLMEYIANRLGLVFMKVNGPALGHSVVSLDPNEAPNATARQEVRKINLAFEMGNNVMLYLDDIQHCHPELLQKFISLCDGQRRIEGVWEGQTRTYDLRGKKFCVIMAGNPYTESGDKFQIPDMLANRADTYNLGDILEGKDAVFALSYVENSLTSNPVLAPLATRSMQDTYKIIRMAQGEEIASNELEHDYASAELGEIISVLQKLFVAQDVLLKVNLQYIASASMDDNYRTEPPFKLQGSYRNMNKIAEKIAPAMNDAELQALITDHYVSEAQTLTTGAEQNLLKLAELRGTMTPEQHARWEDIKKNFKRLKMMGGAEDDPVTRVTGTLAGVSDQLGAIREALVTGVNDARKRGSDEPEEGGGRGFDSLIPLFERLQQAFERLSTPQLDVTLTNSIPPSVDELFTQQAILVERANAILDEARRLEGKPSLEAETPEKARKKASTKTQKHKVPKTEVALKPVQKSDEDEDEA